MYIFMVYELEKIHVCVQIPGKARAPSGWAGSGKGTRGVRAVVLSHCGTLQDSSATRLHQVGKRRSAGREDAKGEGGCQRVDSHRLCALVRRPSIHILVAPLDQTSCIMHHP